MTPTHPLPLCTCTAKASNTERQNPINYSLIQFGELWRLLISLLMAQGDRKLGRNEPARSRAGIDMLMLPLMGYFHSLVNSLLDHNYGCLSDTQEDEGRALSLATLLEALSIRLKCKNTGCKLGCFHGWMGGWMDGDIYYLCYLPSQTQTQKCWVLRELPL